MKLTTPRISSIQLKSAWKEHDVCEDQPEDEEQPNEEQGDDGQFSAEQPDEEGAKARINLRAYLIRSVITLARG